MMDDFEKIAMKIKVFGRNGCACGRGGICMAHVMIADAFRKYFKKKLGKINNKANK